MSSEEVFTYFWNGPFSQWHSATFKDEQYTFANAEQYMMYRKAKLFNDENTMMKILAIPNPKAVKALGRQVKGFDEHVWKNNRENVVYMGNYLKFSQNPHLLEILFRTRGTCLVEASPYDNIWGVGLRESDPRIKDRKTWKGLNLLGKTLTRVRDDLYVNKE